MSDNQLRGHCQCCGGEQAVTRGIIAKHGYKVNHGYFQGVCQGYLFTPMEVSRQETECQLEAIEQDAKDCLQKADLYRSGAKLPEFIKTDRIEWYVEKFTNLRKNRAVKIPFAEGSDYQKKHAVANAILNLEQRAKYARFAAADLNLIANLFHGQPLKEVKRNAPAARIEAGEQKKRPNGLILTAEYQDGARVYYTYQGVNGSGRGWAGSRAWRALEGV